MMSIEAKQPKSKSWVWNEHRGELVKVRQDGRPASPSASSSTSRRLSLQSGQKPFNKELLTSRRLVESEWGGLDAQEWESQPETHVTLHQCIKVSLHLQAAQTPLSQLYLKVVKLPKVRELLKGLVEYFAELFVQADLIRGIEPPAVGNQEVLEERWRQKLGEVLNPLAATYGQLILGHGLENLHHMKRGRSLHSYGPRDSHIFERLYELCELLVWVVFRRRDRTVIHAEITRLFRGKPGVEHEEQNLQDVDVGRGGDDAPTEHHINPPIRRFRTVKRMPITGVVKEGSGLMLQEIPQLSLTSAISSLGNDALPQLVYVSQSEGIRGRGVWVLGARRQELNEYLEPAVQEEDQLSLLD